jgi:hypothetical protein
VNDRSVNRVLDDLVLRTSADIQDALGNKSCAMNRFSDSVMLFEHRDLSSFSCELFCNVAADWSSTDNRDLVLFH